MNITPQKIEKSFAVFSLIFFTQTLYFHSLFVASEGSIYTANSEITSPLTSLLIIIQHLIFIITSTLLILRPKNTLATLKQSKIILFLMLVFLGSFLWSQFPDITLRRSFSLLETTAFGLYLSSRFNLLEQLDLLVKSFWFTILINIAFTLIFSNQAIESGVHSGAWRAALSQKNFFGRLMTLSGIIFLTIRPEQKRGKILSNFGLFLSFVLVLLSTSKTALLAFVSLSILIFFYDTLNWEYRLASGFQLICILGIATAIPILVSQLDYVQGILGRDLTFTGRTEIWAATIQKISEQPWLGYGYWGFWKGHGGPYLDVLKIIGANAYAPHSHNGFIELATSVGIVGLILIVMSFFSSFKYGIYLSKNFVDRERLWILMYLSFLIIYNQTENTLVEHNSIYWVLYVSTATSKLKIVLPK